MTQRYDLVTDPADPQFFTNASMDYAKAAQDWIEAADKLRELQPRIVQAEQAMNEITADIRITATAQGSNAEQRQALFQQALSADDDYRQVKSELTALQVEQQRLRDQQEAARHWMSLHKRRMDYAIAYLHSSQVDGVRIRT